MFSESLKKHCSIADTQERSTKCVNAKVSGCASRGRQLIFTPVWCRDMNIPKPAGRQHQLTAADQVQYALCLGWDFAYKKRCDYCLDRKKQQNVNAVSRKKELRKSGIQISNRCPQRDVEAFAKPDSLQTCKECYEKNEKQRKGKVDDQKIAAPINTIFCQPCGTYQPMLMMCRRFRNIVTKEVVSSPTTVCCLCLDKNYDNEKSNMAKTNYETEKRKEKLDEFKFKTRTLKCRGCSENCPLSRSHCG